MSGESWICRNRQQFDMFVAHIAGHWDWTVPLSISWTSGVKKSMGQNALVHVWFREIARHLNKLPGRDGMYTEDDMKDYCKKRWGIRKDFIDPMTGEEMQKLKSLGDYLKGEMTAFMNCVSEFAASIGCTLPVWGEFESLRASA